MAEGEMRGNECPCLRSSSSCLFLIKMLLVLVSLNWFMLDASQKLAFDFPQEKVD